MAPLSKESEGVLAPGAAAPSPAVKSPELSKPQPVAIEIPVTINGAHTVNGSGKREPFSESTNTVLLFAHGAVVRLNTPLAPGQLVFLTNEKTKKEIVCQAVKSKSGGSNTYVELKFTEPAPGFWGIRTQGATETPLATGPLPKAPGIPTVAPKPEIIKEVRSADAMPPMAIALPPAPVTVPPPVSVVPPPTVVPAASSTTGLTEMPTLTSALLEAAPKSVPSLVSPTPLATEPPVPTSKQKDSSEQSSSSTVSDEARVSMNAQEPAGAKLPVATFKDFSKEIDALFGVPMSPSVRPSAPAPPVTESKDTSIPSTQELKVHTAELQAKLSAMLFSEAPASAPAKSPAESSTESTSPSPDGLAAKLLEFAQEPPRSFTKAEPDSILERPPLAPKPVLPSLSPDDEVKIPAWLAPLSQSSDSATSEAAASNVASSETAVEIENSSSTENLAESHGDAVRRSQASVFGGQLLGKAAPSASNSGRSKGGLLLTLAAAAILLAAAAAWYFLYGPGAPTNASTHPTHTTSSVERPKSMEAQTASQVSQPEPTPAVGNVNPAPTDSLMASPLPSKASSVAASPAVFSPNPERRPATPPTQQVVSVEPQKKPALGNVHLAAPVVNRGSKQMISEAEPAIETSTPATGADAAAAFTRSKAPSAPLPVGGDVKPAQLIKSVPPEYPQIAKSQHVSGNVQIDALVDASGKVAEVKAISGPQLLYRAALDAVKQWKYSPATLNGQPTSMHLTVMVQFRAQ